MGGQGGEMGAAREFECSHFLKLGSSKIKPCGFKNRNVFHNHLCVMKGQGSTKCRLRSDQLFL